MEFVVLLFVVDGVATGGLVVPELFLFGEFLKMGALGGFGVADELLVFEFVVGLVDQGL